MYTFKGEYRNNEEWDGIIMTKYEFGKIYKLEIKYGRRYFGKYYYFYKEHSTVITRN